MKTNRNSTPPAILLKWAKGISTNNPKYMTSFYSKRAVLLATYEPLALGRKDIYNYFVDFLNKTNMKCQITTCINQRGLDGVVVSSGFYTFTFEDKLGLQEVEARFTYVILDNKIVTHHSSEMPD
jgi:hypothetical protein